LIFATGAPTAQHVFIATDDNSFDNGGSLFESTDGGVTWIPVTDFLGAYVSVDVERTNI
jgi:hypothetical protein